jgi:hypothetical protein
MLISRWVSMMVVALLGCTPLPRARATEPARVDLAVAGEAVLPVVTSAQASPRVRQAAQTLVRYLDRISGATFSLRTGDGASGIAVGRVADFPTLSLADAWDLKDKTHREDYLLRSHKTGLQLIGATDLAVEHAVWDLLYRLGHRQFFPGETWGVVPRSKDLALAVDVRAHPSFHARHIWYGYGPWDYSAKPYAEWCARNRATSGIVLRTGHAYEGILQAHKNEFAAHPEYLAEVGGQRVLRGDGTKFCIANSDLRRLVVRDALARIAKDPEADSLSMEPSDGLGWCECAQCRALGSPSDRALLLANEVAAAVNAGSGEHYVGMYAYSAHSPPPTIKADPHVVVSVATAFLRDGWTSDDLMDRWHQQGAIIGVREYYGVHPWDRDLPGQPRASNLTYLKTTIPHFHQKGARFLSAESSDNWGPSGLGYYLAACMLWDVRQAEQIDALVTDFLDKAFGPAREPMAAFYRLLDGANQPLLSDDLIGRMYRCLTEARSKTDDPMIQARLDDLVLYTHYVELFRAYSSASAEERQQAFEQLLRHAYRMRRTMMIHTLGLYRDLPRRDRKVKVPAEAAWNVPEGKNPWKSSAPFSREELDEMQRTGIARHPLRGFEPVAFSRKLQPPGKFNRPEVPRGSFGTYLRGSQSYYTWLTGESSTVRLSVKGGLVYQSAGAVKLALEPAAKTEAVERTTVPPDKSEHAVPLRSSQAGLHRLEVADRTGGTVLTLPEELPWTLPADFESTKGLHGRWSLYFYVPKGTTIVGGYAGGTGVLLDGAGHKVCTFEASPNYFRVPVPLGQDGKLWKFENSLGPRVLLTVPPYLARSGRELLLPAEVVRDD